MFLFGNRRSRPALKTEVAGIVFDNPVGVSFSGGRLRESFAACMGAGFITLEPPREGILEWIGKLQELHRKTVLAVNLPSDILRRFSLVYDFADLIILDPDSDNGIDSPDISDTSNLLEEVVSLRLCYEQYTPIFLRLSHGVTPDELHPLLAQSRLCGLDGIVASSLSQARLVREETQGRVPLIGVADSPETALKMLSEGVSLVETGFGSLHLNKLLKQLEKQ